MKHATLWVLGAAIVGAATHGRPLAWTVIGLAVVGGALTLSAPEVLKKRVAPLAAALLAGAAIAMAPALAGLL